MMYNKTTEMVKFSCEFEGPSDNTTEYSVVWRTKKFGGEWMENDDLLKMKKIDSGMLKNFTYGSMVRILLIRLFWCFKIDINP